MSSRLAAVKGLAALVLAAGLRGAALADDLGQDVFFPVPNEASSAVPSQAGALWESGPSAAIPGDWDTVLFQGVCPDSAAVFLVSRQLPDGRWTPWQEVQVQRFPRGRFWGKYQFPNAGPGGVRLRAVDGGLAGALAPGIQVLSVEVLAAAAPSGTTPALPMMLAVGGGTRPFIYSRQSWGAKPPKQPYDPLLPYRITLHHTSGIQPMSLAEAEQELRFIQDFHQNGRGWSDIAYHFLIDGAGHVFEGRPETAEGSHTLHNNEGNIGIALMGNYEPPTNDRVTPAQRDALASLGQYLVQRYGIDPETLKGHRDYKQTSCPGDEVYALIPELRREFAQTRTLAKRLARKSRKARKPKTLRALKSSDWDGAGR